jgi:hypothetical protein
MSSLLTVFTAEMSTLRLQCSKDGEDCGKDCSKNTVVKVVVKSRATSPRRPAA